MSKKKKVIETEIVDTVVEEMNNESLIDAIDKAIVISQMIMEQDRTRVLRLKNLVIRLLDAKKLVK